MIFVGVFLGSWVLFACLFQRERFREIYPTSLLAMVLGLTSDVLTDFHPLWTYNDSRIPLMLIKVLDDYGLYFVVSYLYIQHIPATPRKWFPYTFVWTIGCLSFEGIMVSTGHMKHQLGWEIWDSYFADWLIMGVISLHYSWSSRKGKLKRKQLGVPESLLHNMADVVIWKDCHGRWQEVNEFTRELLHLQDGEYQGKTDEELAGGNPFFREVFAQCAKSDQKTWEAGSSSHFIEKVPNRSGESLTLSITKIPLYDENGERQGILVLGMKHPSATNHETYTTLKRPAMFPGSPHTIEYIS